MKVSVCITVFNEEKSIEKLLSSLITQTRKPDEIVVVDGGSTDKTVKMIKKFKSKNKLNNLKLIVKKCTRAEGRNISAKNARFDIIAVTDADCITKKSWLLEITKPFKEKDIDISAGFYEMTGDSYFQRAEAVFLGVMPDDFDEKSFLPSTRSIAFRKSAWKRIGGFPEKGNNSAEDTDFNYLAVKMGMKYSRVKSARVEWRIPPSIKEYYKKVYDYAKWDAKNGEMWDKSKGVTSHNIKVILKLIRYLFFLILLFLSMIFGSFFVFALILLLLLYSSYSFYKVYTKTKNIRAGLWGVVIQYISDMAGIVGFILGMKERIFEDRNSQLRDRGNSKVFKIMMYIKYFYLFLRNWVYLNLGHKVVYCLGDSHMKIFKEIGKDGSFNKTHLTVFAVGSATAMGMGNPLSKTKAYVRFNRFLKYVNRKSHILVGLGEVDCGFVIWYRKDKYKTSVAKQLNYALERYQKFLEKIKNMGFGNIIILSAQPPTIMNGRDKGEVAKLRIGINANLKQRTELTEKFNKNMKDFCMNENMLFLDLASEVLNSRGIVSKKYLSENVYDHHLNIGTTLPILVKELKGLGFE